MKNKRKVSVAKSQQLPPESVFINPFCDFGFKKIFTGKENKELTVDFLNALLKGEKMVKNIVLTPVERAGSTRDVRKVIFDAEGESSDNTFFIMEMQDK